MKKFLSLIGVSVLCCQMSFAQLVSSPETEGIWFKNAETFPKRFLYSQTILWPSSIAGHIGLYIAKDDFDWSRAVRKSVYLTTFTTLPDFDQDHWSWNYEVHPYMGSISYLTYRNRKASVWESAIGAGLNSIIYEYIIAGGTQPPSLNDMIVTPIAGSLLGEGLYQFKKLLLKDRHLNTLEKILITICDPVEVFYFGFDYSKLTRQDYRK